VGRGDDRTARTCEIVDDQQYPTARLAQHMNQSRDISSATAYQRFCRVDHRLTAAMAADLWFDGRIFLPLFPFLSWRGLAEQVRGWTRPDVAAVLASAFLHRPI